MSVLVCIVMDTSVPSIGNSVGYVKETEPIKLFVGQIPKNYDEGKVREIMEPFGPISEVNIIKDKDTGHSRG